MKQKAVRWEISVPIFENRVVLEQLALAIGIPFGLISFLIILVSKGSRDMLYALGLIATLLVLAWLLIMVAYRGNYEVEFVLDNKGVLCRTQEKQGKRNRVINGLTVMLGLLTGKPTVAGAGLLAQSRQEVFIPWSGIRKMEYKPHNHTILLRGSILEHVALFCTEDNCTQTEDFVKERLFTKGVRS